MNERDLFSKMKDTSGDGYAALHRAASAGATLVRLAVFPLVISAVLAGGAITAADGLVSGSVAAVANPRYKTSGAAVKSLASAPAPRQEDERDADEEVLKTLYEFDRRSVPDGMVGIIPVSLHREAEEGKVWVSDSGDKRMIEAEPYLSAASPVSFDKDEPCTVLIIHTHGTESFSEPGQLYCKPGYYPRSSDEEKNVIAIGDVFEEAFTAAGINTVHCRIPIDGRSYSNAYSNAADIIKEYIKEYPGIKYMFDIHRDSVDMTDGSKTRMVTSCGGKPTAQVMFVVGTDRLVSKNVNWRDNMALAVKLQCELDGKYPGLMRPINVKQGAFNQFYTPLSVLIEVGCDGNSMEEAKRAAALTADALIEQIKKTG